MPDRGIEQRMAVVVTSALGAQNGRSWDLRREVARGGLPGHSLAETIRCRPVPPSAPASSGQRGSSLRAAGTTTLLNVRELQYCLT